MILDGTSSSHDPMKRNALFLFRRPALKTKECTSAALIQLLPVNTVSTLNEYASIVFDSHITVQLQQSTRVDLRNDINTQKLSEFLSQQIMSANYPDGKDSCDRFTDGWLQFMFDPNCSTFLVKFGCLATNHKVILGPQCNYIIITK